MCDCNRKSSCLPSCVFFYLSICRLRKFASVFEIISKHALVFNVLVLHWVSKPIHLTRIRCSGWVKASWIMKLRINFLKLINYACSSYPTRASYSGQVDEFRNPMKNELKTRPWKKPVFETISNTDANFLNLHIDKATKTCGDKQLYLITHFTKQTLNLNYLLLALNATEQFLKNPKQKGSFFF